MKKFSSALVLSLSLVPLLGILKPMLAFANEEVKIVSLVNSADTVAELLNGTGAHMLEGRGDCYFAYAEFGYTTASTYGHVSGLQIVSSSRENYAHALLPEPRKLLMEPLNTTSADIAFEDIKSIELLKVNSVEKCYGEITDSTVKYGLQFTIVYERN